MAGFNLPTGIDDANADSTTDPTVKQHQQHHDVLHRFANRYDDATPGDGQVPTFDAGSGLYKPKTPGASSADLSGTPLVVSAASGGTGAYPVRPATGRPVQFRGTTAPTTDGSTAGGGGMVLGLDQWLYWSGATAGSPSTGSAAVNDATSSSTSAPLSAAATKVAIGAQGPTIQINSPQYLAAGSYGALQSIADTDTAAVITAKLTNNNAIVMAAINDRPTFLAKGPETFYPYSLDLSGVSANLELNMIQYRGSDAQGRVVKPAISIVNPYGAPQQVDLGALQVGPNSPAANLTTQFGSSATLPVTGGTGQDNQGGYRNYRAGQVGMVYCKDPFTWAAEAISGVSSSSNIWRAENISIHGIYLNVTSVNLTGAGTAGGGGYPYLTLERHQIKGATSGVTAYANSWAVDQTAGTTGKLIFGSVSGDFIPGENLVDVASGNTVGVAGSMGIAFAGKLQFDYYLSVRMAVANATTAGTWTAAQITAAKPLFRLINQDAVVNLNVRVKASHDVDTFLTTTERNTPAVQIAGAYCPQIKIESLSGFSRTLVVKSCHRAVIEAPNVQGIANHAIGVTNPNGEEAYGYGIELRGTSYRPTIKANGSFLRHLVTTNPNQRTWESENIAHLDYGCGAMYPHTYSSDASECYGNAFDTHEGAYRAKWTDCNVYRPYSGSRITTSPGGFNSRGFGDLYVDCHVHDTEAGFSNGGVALTAGFEYTTTYRDCSVNGYQRVGFTFSDFQTGLGQDQSGLLASQQAAPIQFALVRFQRTDSSADPSITTSQQLQFGYVCGVGKFDWYSDVRASQMNAAPLRLKAGGVHRFFSGPINDYTKGSNTPYGIRDDGGSLITFFEPVKVVQRSATVPASVIRSIAGGSTIVHKGFDYTTASDTIGGARGAATAFSSADGTAPTYVDTRPATPAAAHSTAVAPAVALVGTNAGTGASVTLAAGSTDLAGEIIVTTGTGPVAGQQVTLTFGTPFPTAAFCSIDASATTADSTSAVGKSPYPFNQSKTGFVLACAAALNASGTFHFAYVVNGV